MTKIMIGKLWQVSVALWLILSLTLTNIPSGHAQSPTSSPPHKLSDTSAIAENTPKAQPGWHPKLDTAMNRLAAAAKQETVDVARSLALRMSQERVQVHITTYAEGLAAATAAVTAAGGEVTGVADRDTLIQAWVPFNALATIAAQEDVYFIRRPTELIPFAPPIKAMARSIHLAGSMTTEGLAVMNGPAWHNQGYTGAGVKIGIIDSGFEGYTSLLGDDLPASVTVKNFVDGELDTQVDGTTKHGTACTEILHDIAPGAALYLAKTATNVDFAEAVAWLKDTHRVNIISTSVGWYNLTPGDGTGEFANLASQARAAGILFVAAAGNGRVAHWGGPYYDPDGDNILNYTADQDVNYFVDSNGEVLSIPAGYPIYVYLRWSDWTYVNQDYDLYLLQWDAILKQWRVIESSTDIQNGGAGQKPREFVYAVTSGPSTYYGFYIKRENGDRDVNIDVFAPNYRLDEVLHARSLNNVADAPDVMAVAAVDVVTPHAHEYYSSEGPTNGPGGVATGGFTKPDIASYAHVSTVSYGASYFSGTSPAAPHVAGAAALVLSAYTGYTADQLQTHLESQAIDMGSTGMDNQFGYGRLYLGDPGPANTQPTLAGLPDQTMSVGNCLDNAIDLWAYANDAESTDSELMFTIDNSPAADAGVSLDSNRYIDICPAANWEGETNVTIRVTDPSGLADTDTFNVKVQNTAPTISGLPDQTVPMNSSADNLIDLWAYASDAESADGDLTFSIDNTPNANAGVSLDSNRYIDVNPTPDWMGETDVAIRVTDPGGLSDTDTFNVAITGKTWNGGTSNDWHTAANWTPSGVPTSDDNVIIPNRSRDPVISSADAQVQSLTLEQGAVLDLTERTLTVEEQVVNRGILKQTQTVTESHTVNFLRLTNQAGTKTVYHGVDITPELITSQPSPRGKIARPAADPEIDVSPTAFDETVVIGTKVTRTLTISNSGTTSLTFTIAEDYADWLFQDPMSDTVPPEGVTQVAVVFDASNLVTNTYPASLVINNNDPDENPVVIPVAMHVTDIPNTPPSLDDLPDQTVPMNDRADRAIDLWNYAQDAEDTAGELTHTIANTPILSAGVSITGNRYVAIAPLTGWTGETDVLIQVTDTGGLTATNAFSVTVSRLADIAVSPTTFEETLAEGERLTRTLKISNTGTASLTFEIAEDYVAWLAQRPTSGTLSPGHAGVITVTFDATAQSQGTYPANLIINNNDPDENPTIVPILMHVSGPANAPPTIAGLPDQTLSTHDSNGQAIDLWAYASDAEDIDTNLTYSITNAPPISAGITITANRYIAIAPLAGWIGTTEVIVQVTDTGGLTDTDAFTVTITGIPDITVTPTAFDQTVITGTQVVQVLTISNTGAASLTFEIAEDYVTWLSQDPISGTVLPDHMLPITVTFDATAQAIGNYPTNMVIHSNDPDESTIAVAIVMRVTEPNTPPSLTGLPDQSLAMNGRAEQAIDLWTYVNDAEDAKVDLSFSLANTPIVSAGVTITANRYIAIAPVADWTGTTEVVVQVADTEELTDTDAFTVTIMGVPDITVSPTAFEKTLIVGTKVTPTLRISNTGMNELSFEIIEDPEVAWLSQDPVSGTVPMSAALPAKVVFDAGSQTAGQDYTTTLMIHNNDPDENPVAVPVLMHVKAITKTPPTLTGLPDQRLPKNGHKDNAIDLWAYANDAEDDVADLTFAIANTPDANAGVSLDSNRYIDINPTSNWTGQTTVTIRATDADGLSDTDSFTVTVTTNATRVTVEVMGNQLCSNRTTGVARCFTVTPDDALTATVRFHFNETERNNLTLNQLAIFRYHGASWEKEAGPYKRGSVDQGSYVESANIDDLASDTTINFALDESFDDDYEPDDACTQAQPITTDGTVQIHTFHDQTDEDWAKFSAISGTTYLIEARVPDGSDADVVLQIYNQCGGNSEAHDSFGPEVRLQFEVPTSGDIYLQVTNYANAYGSDTLYQLSVRELSDTSAPGALVLVAGRLKANDSVQDNIYKVTNDVYELFLSKDYTPDRIYYMAYNTNLDPDDNPATQDVDAQPSRERLEYAITQWATDAQLGLGPDRALTLYMMDHGKYDGFFLNTSAEIVNPDDLNTWLNTLEAAAPGVNVNVIIDACYAGSFVDMPETLSKPGRVVIASTTKSASAYASREGGAMFSDSFIQALGRDMSLYSAFKEAQEVAEAWHASQKAWLDDDGDSRANTSDDGEVAQLRGFAYPGSMPGLEPPYIAWVKGPETIANNRGTIQALVEDDVPGATGLNVWAVIYEPSYAPPPPGEEMVLEANLPTVRLEDMNNDDVYEGVFTGFDQLGAYRIVVYAVDEDGLESRPRAATLQTGWGIYLPLVIRE